MPPPGRQRVKVSPGPAKFVHVLEQFVLTVVITDSVSFASHILFHQVVGTQSVEYRGQYRGLSTSPGLKTLRL